MKKKAAVNKILIVDDDAWLAESYRLALESKGWRVGLAASGAEAINRVDDFRPDVILLDIMLPGSSAPALLNELQSHSDLAGLPVVLCSSLNLKDISPLQLKEYGVRQVIDKTTTSPEEIIRAAEDALHAIP